MKSIANSITVRVVGWLRSPTARDIVFPLALGCVLNSINLYEVGLNFVPVIRNVLAPTVVVSQTYFESGPWGVVIAGICVGLMATRSGIAWSALYLPTFLARMITGTTLFISDQANLWPVFFFGDILLGLVSFALIYGVFKLKCWGRSKVQSQE